MSDIKNKIALVTQVGGIEYDTAFREYINKGEWVGRANRHEAIIELAIKTDDYPVSNKSMVNTYWHEVIHIMLHDMGRHDLSDDESFVGSLTGKLVEVLNCTNFMTVEDARQMFEEANKGKE